MAVTSLFSGERRRCPVGGALRPDGGRALGGLSVGLPVSMPTAMATGSFRPIEARSARCRAYACTTVHKPPSAPVSLHCSWWCEDLGMPWP